MPGSVWSPVLRLCRPGAAPVVHSAAPVVAGPSRLLPGYLGGIKHFNSFPEEPRLSRSSPVHPGRPRWSLCSSR
ncbi:hypothetical protein DPMN_172171 [Dreissena polymorpha]|uniref:Uncharacterized protein n=1 Tax=Dreissena polymorpha TaxID=45954 RepID=A0A9D4DZC5_DREPO|nr:hypothetical protein DPMN_172171 [Dreissena polymorpha]